jgi:hypothetical protein
MVSLDYLEPRYVRRTLTDRANLLPPLFALAAALLATVTYARSGPDSWPYASDIVLRFATLVFPIAIAAGPVGRLILGQDDWRPGRWSRMSVLSFAAVYAVFLVCVALPYFVTDTRMPLETMGFCFFNAFILCVLAITATERFSHVVGNRTVDTMNRVAAFYFWVVFAFADVAHLYGPHRPDGFYGLSLLLLVASVLIRFGDALVARVRNHLAEHARHTAAWQEKGDDCHSRQPRGAVRFGHVQPRQAPFGRHAGVQERADPGRRRALADPCGSE